MKTQEEIEQLAKKHFPNSNYAAEFAITSIFRSGFIDGYNYCQEDMANTEQDWTNFESEMMDWAHELGKEQKYIPFPAQVLQWIKKNYKLPQKK